MMDYDDDDDDDGKSKDNSVQLYVNEKTRDVREARDYDKLDERIDKIQTYIKSIKQTQDKILELLQSK
jgi:hypothetical protein